jgi:cytochrome c-type biogenesis protein CcmH/NrfF
MKSDDTLVLWMLGYGVVAIVIVVLIVIAWRRSQP